MGSSDRGPYSQPGRTHGVRLPKVYLRRPGIAKWRHTTDMIRTETRKWWRISKNNSLRIRKEARMPHSVCLIVRTVMGLDRWWARLNSISHPSTRRTTSLTPGMRWTQMRNKWINTIILSKPRLPDKTPIICSLSSKSLKKRPRSK